jgi:glycosyltransferase involved in cell wall biosynthesis
MDNDKIKPEDKREEIFLLGPSFPFRGGISHYNTLLLNHLQKTHRVMLYTYKKQYFQWLFPGKDDKDNSEDKIKPDDARPFDNNNGLHIKRELHPLNIMSWIKAGKEAGKYPLILLPWWVTFWAPYYFLFLKSAKKSSSNNNGNNNKNNSKIIFVCHNVEEHEKNCIGWLKRIVTRNILGKAHGFILHSRGEENQLSQLLKDKMKPSVVAPIPIYEVFNKNRYTPITSKEILGIPSQQRVILFFGFVRKYKGLDYLLKALPIVKTFDPNILLLIVGEVWGRKKNYDRYIRSIKNLGIEENIRFINRYVPNEEVELYFKASDIAVLPYINGSGSAILQVAYGMDRPVIATGIGAFEDVVEHGKTGFIVPPADEKGLAEAVIEMYRSDSIPRMENEIRQYKKKFEWSFLVEKILHLSCTLEKR